MNRFSGILQELIDRAVVGDVADVDFIMSHLSGDSTELCKFIPESLG